MPPMRILAAIVGLSLLPSASLAQETADGSILSRWFCVREQMNGAAGNPRSEGSWLFLTSEGFEIPPYGKYPFTGLTSLGNPYSLQVTENENSYTRTRLTLIPLKQSLTESLQGWRATVQISMYVEYWEDDQVEYQSETLDCFQAPH
jgi:hypothetical protein